MCLTTWRGFVHQTKNQTANVTTPNLKILSRAVASPIKEGKHKKNPSCLTWPHFPELFVAQETKIL